MSKDFEDVKVMASADPEHYHVVVRAPNDGMVLLANCYNRQLAELLRDFIIEKHPEFIEQARQEMKKYAEERKANGHE